MQGLIAQENSNDPRPRAPCRVTKLRLASNPYTVACGLGVVGGGPSDPTRLGKRSMAPRNSSRRIPDLHMGSGTLGIDQPARPLARAATDETSRGTTTCTARLLNVASASDKAEWCTPNQYGGPRVPCHPSPLGCNTAISAGNRGRTQCKWIHGCHHPITKFARPCACRIAVFLRQLFLTA